jgi:hypothetical protein
MRLTSSVRLHSPTLVRELAALDVAEVPADRATLAERLGGWLGWTDAIALAAVLDAPVPAPAGRAPAFDAAGAVAQARAALARAIDTMGPLDEDDPEGQRRHRQQQQAMEARLGPLRARLRAALAARSADGARLAALDAVLEQALAARWREALAAGPGWLARHRRVRGGAAGPALQRLLRAELDLRLEPLHGLAEALA